MAKFVALLRGINVGRAKQLPMADLKRVIEELGARNVVTVLRSGNVVFEVDATPGVVPVSAASIAAGVLAASGVESRTLVLTAEDFAAIARANPLIPVATDGAKLFVTFLSEPGDGVQAPDVGALAPERLVVGDRAIYQWFPDGSLQTKVPKSFWAQINGLATARNGNTVAKILALL